MHILFLIRSCFAGGAEKVLLDYAKGLDKEKFDVTIMLRYPDGALKDQFFELQDHGVHIRWCFDHLKPGKNLFEKAKNVLLLRLADWSAYHYPKLYYRLAIKEQYDVEIAFMHNEAASIIASSPNKKSKKLLWVHTDLRRLTSFKTYFGSRKKQGAYYRKFDKCICVSQVAAKSLAELFGIRENVQIIHNPIDRDRIISLAQSPLPLSATTPPTICAVGRLSLEKNFPLLINAHANLIKKDILHHLYIVGEGPEREALEQKIRELNVENSVSLIGFLPNPYPYIFNADFLALSSIYEGFPTVIMESLILGIPVVSCCGVTNEVFGNYNCGIVTEPDEVAFEAGLEKMLTDSVLRNNCAEQAALRGAELDLTQAISAIEQLLVC